MNTQNQYRQSHAPLSAWYQRHQTYGSMTPRHWLPIKQGQRGGTRDDADLTKLLLTVGFMACVTLAVLSSNGCNRRISYDNSAPLQLVIPVYFSKR